MVSVGIDHDAAQSSVAAITAWWEQFGRSRYPDATRLVITADCGGSNGALVAEAPRAAGQMKGPFI